MVGSEYQVLSSTGVLLLLLEPQSNLFVIWISHIEEKKYSEGKNMTL